MLIAQRSFAASKSMASSSVVVDLSVASAVQNPVIRRRRRLNMSSSSLSVIGLMILVSTLFLVAALSNSSSPSVDINKDIQERRLSKHHHNHTSYNQDEDIDYRIYSCDALRDLRRKIDNKPGRRFDQCKFAHDCNEGEGIIFPSLFCDYDDHTTPTTDNNDGSTTASAPPSSSQHTNIQYHHIPLLVFLSLCLLLLFRLLNSTTDEFFSPGLELFSLKLGLPPRFAGVTLLALGNGAPDVAATMNAILGDERRGYEMALGELTGTCMFVTSVILGVIVSLSGHSKKNNETTDTNIEGESPKKGSNKKDEFCNPESLHESRRESARSFAMESGVPCQGPLLRDIAVLILVCVVSMSYLKRGIIDYGFVYTLMGMYVSYVLLVLGADAYHIFYHAPLMKRGDSGLSLDDLLLEEEDDNGANDDVEENPITEQTSLIQPSTTKPTFTRRAHSDRHHHKQHAHHLYHNNSLPIHSHTIGETMIEAMSNYSCNESQPLRQHHCSGMQDITTNLSKESKTSDTVKVLDGTQAVAPPPPPPCALSPTTSPSGWAPVEDDGAEPLVIFHPHHAIHPHHGHGGLFLRSKSTDSAVKNKRLSWSEGDDNAVKPVGGKLRHSSSCDASSSHTSLSEKPSAVDEAGRGVVQQHHAGAIQITNSNVTEDAANDIRNMRPMNWNEALSENIQEFRDHWHAFFTDIYHNEENSFLDIVLLSMELPFTIIRKVSFKLYDVVLFAYLFVFFFKHTLTSSPSSSQSLFHVTDTTAVHSWLYLYRSPQFGFGTISWTSMILIYSNLTLDISFQRSHSPWACA